MRRWRGSQTTTEGVHKNDFIFQASIFFFYEELRTIQLKQILSRSFSKSNITTISQTQWSTEAVFAVMSSSSTKASQQ